MGAGQHPHSIQTRSKQAQKAQLDTSKVNDPGTQDPVGPRSEGEAVVRARILLDRLKFSPGEISGSYNENLGKAIAAFQSASGLPAIGQMDAVTWKALNDDQTTGHVEAAPGQQNQPQGGQAAQNHKAPESFPATRWTSFKAVQPGILPDSYPGPASI